MQRTHTEPPIVVSESSTNSHQAHSSFISHQANFASAAFPARLSLPFLVTFAITVPALINAGSTPVAAAPSKGRLILAQAQTNQPAAQPGENPPALTVPVTPDGGADVNPAPGTGNQTGGATVAPPITTPEVPPAATAPTVVTPPADEPPTVTGPTLDASTASGREIATVRVVGTQVIQPSTILLQVQNTRQGAAYSPTQTQLDVTRIENLGFFRTVEVQVTPNLEDLNKVDVAFVVVENRVISCFKFAGVTSVPEAELLKVLESTIGTVLNYQAVDRDVEKIRALYRSRGYLVDVTGVEPQEDGCVLFTIKEGNICKVNISGAKKTRESLIRDQIRTKTGSALDETALRRDAGRIYDMGFFEDVQYKIDPDPDAFGCFNVTFVVKERRTGSFSLGVGFDSRSKITGFAGLSETNFRGTGQRVSAQIEVGGQRSFDLGYGNPYLNKRGAALDVNLFDRRVFREPRSVLLLFPNAPVTTLAFQEQRQGGRVSYSHPLNLNRDRTLLFGYRNEKVRLFQTDNNGTNTPLNLPVNTAGRTSGISAGFLRDKRDLRSDPSRGGREQFLVERGLGILGGTATFTKLDVDLRRYFPLMKPEKAGQQPKLVLAGRLVVGHSLGQLPAFEQYFVGGSETVRGYDVDEQFGDNQVYGNLELRYRFQRKFQLVAFADVGSAYGGAFASQQSFKAMTGFGGGIRLQTPIGPVRLDIGRGDQGIKTHFGIGVSY